MRPPHRTTRMHGELMQTLKWNHAIVLIFVQCVEKTLITSLQVSAGFESSTINENRQWWMDHVELDFELLG